MRNELKKTRKVYFYDNGIRNAVLGDYRPLALRNDKGGLWENFLVSERIKMNRFHGFYGHMYFWRTTSQQEMDYLEEYDGQLHAYEFKWGAEERARLPASFAEAYPEATFTTVNSTDYQSFLSPS